MNEIFLTDEIISKYCKADCDCSDLRIDSRVVAAIAQELRARRLADKQEVVAFLDK